MLALFNRQNLAQQNAPAIESINSLRSRKLPQGHYDRRSTGLSVDFAYVPESLKAEMASGGYGEAIPFEEVMGKLGNYPCEGFRGVTVIGTDAGRYLGKRLVNHFENYGFGSGYMFDTTKVIAVIPLSNALGCGECPGSTVVVSPCGWHECLDTLAHEHYHNIGLDHKYGPGGPLDQLDKGNDPIYINAAKVASYLSRFPES